MADISDFLLLEAAHIFKRYTGADVLLSRPAWTPNPLSNIDGQQTVLIITIIYGHNWSPSMNFHAKWVKW